MSELAFKQRSRAYYLFRKYGRVIVGGIIIAVIVFCSVFADFLTDYDPMKIDLGNTKQPASAEHFMGTDKYGRDLWSRVLYGSQNNLLIAFGTQIVVTIVGTVLGLLCGYYNKVEKYLMRVLEGFALIPNILLMMMLASIAGAGVPNMILAMSMGGFSGIARMIRNQVLSIREKEYIESERAMGASDIRTMFIHVLPQCSTYLINRFSGGLAGSIMALTTLSYLGFGLDPTVPSWGGIIAENQSAIFGTPHLVLYPGIAVCLTVFGFQMLGDGIRDLLDPKLR
jgi:ABC-type dipeptide/oligopeptide/nickel transport system permease subunit